MTADEQGPDTAPLDLDRFEYDLDFDLAELGEDQSECGWPRRVAALIAELRAARTERDTALAERDSADTARTCSECGGTPESCAGSGIKCCPDCRGFLHQQRAMRLRAEAAVVTARRDALLEAADYFERVAGTDSNPYFAGVRHTVQGLRARASTQAPTVERQ